MKDENSTGDAWRQKARAVATKINAAWWLEKLGAPLVVTALIGSCLILMARREMAEFPWLPTAFVGSALLLGMGLMAWWLARRNFETEQGALVRIEASMRLRNSLSAAREGVTPWPAVPSRVDDGTRWRWTSLLIPILAAALFLTGSILLPVSARTDPNAEAQQQPQAWSDMEADLAALAEDNTVQEEYLEKMEERIEELRKQNEDEWFSHSSLEATDALQKMHGSELESLERNLRKAERSLEALQKHGGKMGDGARNRLLNEFDQAMQQMNEGMMKPNQALLDQLQQLDPKNLGQLNQEQLDQLRENMKRHAQNCQDCQGNGAGGGQGGGAGGGEEDWLEDLLNDGEDPGQGQAGGDQNQPGEGPGSGGVNRGPGSAPGVLGQLRPETQSGDLEGLESRDLSNTLPGDLLQLADGEHDVDTTEVGIREGGAVENEGEGGDRIWKDSLLPSEKKALKEFFK